MNRPHTYVIAALCRIRPMAGCQHRLFNGNLSPTAFKHNGVQKWLRSRCFCNKFAALSCRSVLSIPVRSHIPDDQPTAQAIACSPTVQAGWSPGTVAMAFASSKSGVCARARVHCTSLEHLLFAPTRRQIIWRSKCCPPMLILSRKTFRFVRRH